MSRVKKVKKVKKLKKVSHCCSAPVVTMPPFQSSICTECVNMTVPVKR